MVVGDRAVGVAVELRELVDVLPHSLVVGVEDVGVSYPLSECSGWTGDIIAVAS